MVEKYLKQLPERTQADIISLLTLSPEEINHSEMLREWLPNAEFEDPRKSML